MFISKVSLQHYSLLHTPLENHSALLDRKLTHACVGAIQICPTKVVYERKDKMGIGFIPYLIMIWKCVIACSWYIIL